MTHFATSFVAAVALAIACGSATMPASAQNLQTFGVLGGQSVTNTGPSVITGDVGVSPGTSITGFGVGLGTVVAPYAIHQTDAVAAQAQTDLTTAYNILAALPPTTDLSGTDLGGQTLTPGVYSYSSSAQLTGILTLDGGGDSNAVFVIVIGSTLTTATASSVTLTGSAQARNVYFVVGSSATLGTTTAFQGKILALTSITLNTGASINCGAALARNGSVTLNTNTILVCGVVAATFAALGSTATANQTAVGQAIDAFVTGGGVLPLGFDVLSVLSPAQLAAAFTQLSGELATAVAPTEVQAMNAFLSILLDRSSRGREDMGSSLPTAPGTVRVLGYAGGPPLAGGKTAVASLAIRGTAADPATREMWGAIYGAQTKTVGDAQVGSHDRFAHTFGFALGFDHAVGPDGKLGFAVSGGGTNFSLSEGLGSGHSDLIQAAIYGRRDLERAYITSALAYAWHGVTTDRYPTLGGPDHFAASFSTHQVAGQVEVGYRLGVFDPYGAIRAQTIFRPAYSERTASGSPTFALDYAANRTSNVRTELGVRFGHDVALNGDATLDLHASTAWAHDYWFNTNATPTFQVLPGQSFTVYGAAPAADSWLVSGGAKVNWASGFALGGEFNAEFARTARTYAGSLKISYAW
jgi:outer membrane autotransporter protein